MTDETAKVANFHRSAHGAGDDRESRVHEHHFKEEDDHDADVVGVAGQEISGLAE